MKNNLSRTFIKILGISFILIGFGILGNVIYGVTIGDDVIAAQQSTASQKFEAKLEDSKPVRSFEPSKFAGKVPITEIPSYGESFAVLHVPRFGDGYSRVIAESVTEDVLSSPDSGVGHVPETQALGELGNFVIAGHRKNNGGTFRDIDKLQVGDSIIVEAEAGSYYYHFVSQEIVEPTQVGVLLPVPNEPDTVATGRVITIFSCYPLYSSAERIVAYGVFDKFVPRGQ